jgi:hypothetical protein
MISWRKIIATESRIGVAFVVNPVQIMRCGISLQRRSRHIEQGADQACAKGAVRTLGDHSAGTVHPGATQKIEQDSLRLIVAVMRQGDPLHAVRTALGKFRMAQAAGGGLKPFAAVARHQHMAPRQRNIPVATESATEIGPSIGVGAEAMMDMECRKLDRNGKMAQRVQQHDRIAAARERDAQSLARFQP